MLIFLSKSIMKIDSLTPFIRKSYYGCFIFKEKFRIERGSLGKVPELKKKNKKLTKTRCFADF